MCACAYVCTMGHHFKGLTMTTDTWTNDRHAAACDAVDRLDTATDFELLDALTLRVERMGKPIDEDAREGTRYTITLLLAELGKRYGGGQL